MLVPHPALKHAGYSATTLLPGEDSAALEKLLRDLIADLKPVGPLEDDIVADIARLTWRKQNLRTFRIAERAKRRHEQLSMERAQEAVRQLNRDKSPPSDSLQDALREYEARVRGYQAAEKQAREEFGDIYQLIEIGEAATMDGLKNELDIKERLDGLIAKKLKQLLMVRGVKSLSLASPSVPTPKISGPATSKLITNAIHRSSA